MIIRSLLILAFLVMFHRLDCRAEDESPTTFSNLAPTEAWPEPVADEETHSFLLAELFEYRFSDGEDEAKWDVFGWGGGDYDRLWVKSEGEASTGRGEGQGDVQLLYGRMISRFLDFQAGLRYAQRWGEGAEKGKAHLALGVQGVVPYYFDMEPTLFVSQDGNLSARFTGTFDILLTQRLILQPRLETTLAVQSQSDFGIGSGINDVDTGLRIRYEIRREFAPYIGMTYTKRFGETGDLARRDGEDTMQWSFVTGIWFWF